MSDSNYIKWQRQDLREVGCDNCGSNSIEREYWRADGMRVVECAGCGLAYINPRPHDYLIARLYEKDYFNGKSMEKGIGLRLPVERNAEQYARVNHSPMPRSIILMEQKVGSLLGQKILEIGCATGDLLAKLLEKGTEATGLEISAFASNLARERGLNVKCGTIDELKRASDELYNIILAFEVIEHVLSPKKFLKVISESLMTNGYCILSTPNYGCARKLGNEWIGFKTSFEHIWFFTVEVLERMAAREGLELIYWETSTYNGNQHISLSFVEKQIYRIKKWLAIIDEFGLREFIRLKRAKSLGFYPYGHGHTLLAMFKKRIKH
jgi:2-polyprenyl-3-methyl-5-hydroxy-6-metoxy-1,4-benzoquinol methylase